MATDNAAPDLERDIHDLKQHIQELKKQVALSKKKLLPKDLKITTCDMHTGGEPLRIVESGFPEIKGNTILEKMRYAKFHIDEYRQFLMNEPRGHADMYGAVITQADDPEQAHFGVLFLNNEGYSTMCGHAVIALGRYAIDNKIVAPVSPETEVYIQCACGIVKTFVEYNNGQSGRVRFHSVPAFVYKLDADILVTEFGILKVDIVYGGAFYAIISAFELGLHLINSPVSELVAAGTAISDAVKAQIVLQHPDNPALAFLYGTIITDGRDDTTELPTTNLCVFANAEVDRSPTGSGVTARIAQQYARGYIMLNQVREFESLIGSTFTGKAVKEAKCGSFDAVIVEVIGTAYYTGNHVFKLEENDPHQCGFEFPR